MTSGRTSASAERAPMDGNLMPSFDKLASAASVREERGTGNSPYAGLDETKFWRSGVAETNPLIMRGLYKKRGQLFCPAYRRELSRARLSGDRQGARAGPQGHGSGESLWLRRLFGALCQYLHRAPAARTPSRGDGGRALAGAGLGKGSGKRAAVTTTPCARGSSRTGSVPVAKWLRIARRISAGSGNSSNRPGSSSSPWA